MSFNIALTGLNAVNEKLDAISNNIANVGTTGFKSSRAEFASLYSESQAMGVETLGNTQSISQDGSLVTTGRDLDLAISGGGFFVTRSSSGDIQYTRAGVFGTDNQKYMVNASGQYLQGYPVNDAGVLQVGTVGDLQLQSANLPAKATDSLDFVMNLDSNEAVPATAPFDPANDETYNSTYTTKVFDSQGREHTLTQYFLKIGDNTWDAYYAVDGNLAGGPETLSFSTSGVLTAPTDPVNVTSALAGVDAMSIDIDYTGSSQSGSDFVVTTNNASGYTAGEQTSLSVEEDGRVYANYSNGQRLLQGQVVLASFANPEGLSNESGTAWSETSESGTALVGVPGVGPYGNLASDSLENSNVDLTAQLVDLMEGQRNYQANTKVLATDKELTQALFAAI